MLQEQNIEAQQALDQLFIENLLPFKLCAHRVASLGTGEYGEYIVYFHDRRLPAIDISCCEGECFRDVVRAAVLERIGRLSNALRGNKTGYRTTS